MKVFRKKQGVVARKIAGEMFLVPVCGKLADMRRIFSLNPVGEFIWEHIDGKSDCHLISRGIISMFVVPADDAVQDTADFLKDLFEAGLIEESR